jgi:hypothetical protein
LRSSKSLEKGFRNDFAKTSKNANIRKLLRYIWKEMLQKEFIFHEKYFSSEIIFKIKDGTSLCIRNS